MTAIVTRRRARRVPTMRLAIEKAQDQLCTAHAIAQNNPHMQFTHVSFNHNGHGYDLMVRYKDRGWVRAETLRWGLPEILSNARGQHNAFFREMAVKGGTWHLYRVLGTDTFLLLQEGTPSERSMVVAVPNVHAMTADRMVQKLHDIIRGNVGR